jgi:uncharacterized protein (DUF433 family)
MKETRGISVFIASDSFAHEEKSLPNWGTRIAMPRHRISDDTEAIDVGVEEWLAFRWKCAALALRDSVEIDSRKRGGIPVVRGTRFTISQLLAEIADDRSLSEIANELELDLVLLEQFLRGLSICLDRPAI